MHNRVTSHLGSSPPCTRHPIHACAPVCCVVVDFSSTVSVLYIVPPLSFQPFQMFSSVFTEKFRSNPLCDFRLGTVATSDHETPLTIRKRTRSTSNQFLTSFRFPATTSGKVDPTITDTGRKVIKNITLRINSERSVRNDNSGAFHDRFLRDARFRKTMIEMGRNEEVIREMDKLANEDHTHHATEEEINVYCSNWWIRLNFVGSDTMPVRHRADFKEALSTLHRLKKAEDEAHYQNWWQSSSSCWWNWQDSWWHL